MPAPLSSKHSPNGFQPPRVLTFSGSRAGRSSRGRSSIGRAPGLQPGGCRFDPGRLHSMLNESDRTSSHLHRQRAKSEPSALNLTCHLYRHCVICVTASDRSKRIHQPRFHAHFIVTSSLGSLRQTDRSQSAAAIRRASSKIAIGRNSATVTVPQGRPSNRPGALCHRVKVCRSERLPDLIPSMHGRFLGIDSPASVRRGDRDDIPWLAGEHRLAGRDGIGLGCGKGPFRHPLSRFRKVDVLGYLRRSGSGADRVLGARTRSRVKSAVRRIQSRMILILELAAACYGLSERHLVHQIGHFRPAAEPVPRCG